MSIEFRQYETGDCEKCAEIAAAVWPVVLSVTDVASAVSFMKGYIGLNEALSGYAEICCENGQIAGFLFGRAGTLPKEKGRRQIFRKIAWRYISGEYGGCRRRIRLILANAYSMIKTRVLCSRFEGELTLFAVSPEYQGFGAGKALLNRFIEYARSKDIKTFYLTTDIESNWRFYEKHGFIRYREYTDNGLSVFTGKRVKSFIYYYQL